MPAFLIIAVAMLTACGTAKSGVKDASASAAATAAQSDIAFLQRVTDNAAYARGITSKGEVTLTLDGGEMTLAAAIKLYRDTMIRIQVTPMGLMEVARIELTPTRMTVINRMDREYTEIAYADVPFLARQGIDFFTLQSALWGELFVPGEKQLRESMLPLFTTAAADDDKVEIISPVGENEIAYRWTADAATAQLTDLKATYTSTKGTATDITWTYADHAPLGSKRFATTIALRATTNAALQAINGGITLRMKNPTTTADIEPPTAISDKYRRVTPEELIERVFNRGI